jgi:hypothetical protein
MGGSDSGPSAHIPARIKLRPMEHHVLIKKISHLHFFIGIYVRNSSQIWRMIIRLQVEPIENADSLIAAVDGRISFKSPSHRGKTVIGFHGESLPD